MKKCAESSLKYAEKCETSLKNKRLFVKGIINYDKEREVSRKMHRELSGDCGVV